MNGSNYKITLMLYAIKRVWTHMSELVWTKVFSLFYILFVAATATRVQDQRRKHQGYVLLSILASEFTIRGCHLPPSSSLTRFVKVVCILYGLPELQ